MTTKKAMRLAGALFGASGLMLSASGVMWADVAGAAQSDHKIRICHATASKSNPYVEIEVDINAADGIHDSGPGNGNGDHYLEHKGRSGRSRTPDHDR